MMGWSTWEVAVALGTRLTAAERSRIAVLAARFCLK